MREKRVRSCTVGVLLALIAGSMGLVAASSAAAQDPSVALADAEARAATAESRVVDLEAELAEAEAALQPIEKRARLAAERAEDASDQAATLEAELVARREAAAEELAFARAVHDSDLESHRADVGAAFGFALGTLLLALLTLSWSRLRRWPPIRSLAQASARVMAGVAVAVLLVLLIVGGALLGGSPVLGFFGGLLIVIAFGAPIALILIWRSLRIESGATTALLASGVPRSARIAGAAVLGVLCLAGIGAGLGADEPGEPSFGDDIEPLAAQAQGDPADPPTSELLRAQAMARPLARRADRLDSSRREAQREVDAVADRLDAAEGQLAKAERQVRRQTKLVERQQAAERRAQRRAERESQPPVEPDPGQATSGCAPGYSPCIPPYPPDLDCADVGGPITVTGSDPHGLDADNDGIGCE